MAGVTTSASASHALVPTERHSEVAGAVLAGYPHLAGNFFHAAHTAILMREHGIRRICTRDVDFTRFRFLEVVDPAGAEMET